MPHFNHPFETGFSLHFVDQHDVPSKKSKERPVHFMMKLLCDDWDGEWTEFLKPSVLRAVLVRKNSEFVGLMFEAMAAGFQNLTPQLHLLTPAQQNNSEIRQQVEIYIRNCLSFLPFTEPKNGATISLPHYVDGQWTSVEFSIQRHELTKPSQRCFFTQDRFFAYELTPSQAHPDIRPKMVLQATGYPASDGFFLGLRSNMQVGRTPGDSILKTGLSVLKRWSEGLTQPAELIGISLGASLAMSASRRLDNIHCVYAYNPPGSMKKPQPMPNGPQTFMVVNKDEPAHELGVFADDVDITRVRPEKKYTSRIKALHHAFSFANKGTSTFEHPEPKDINQDNRRWRNPLIYKFGRGAADVLFVRPFAYGIRPALQVPHLAVEKIFGSTTMKP